MAIGGAAVLGAGATIYAGSQAAGAQQKSDAAAIAEQQREYNQTRADFAPWRAAGQTALGSLMSAYGLGSSGTSNGTGNGASSGGSGAYGGFFESPGYQFRLQQGLQAIDRGAAARGQLASGATIKAEQRYGDGLASSEFQNYTNGLAGIAGVGESATGQTAAAGSTAANNISQALISSGNARASSYANMASGINSGINNVMDAYLMSNMGLFGGGGGSAAGAIGLMG